MNVESIVRVYREEWFGEIENKFNQMSVSFSQKSRYWWLSDASRLNLLPWGNASDIEPLLLRWAEEMIPPDSSHQRKSALPSAEESFYAGNGLGIGLKGYQGRNRYSAGFNPKIRYLAGFLGSMPVSAATVLC